MIDDERDQGVLREIVIDDGRGAGLSDVADDSLLREFRLHSGESLVGTLCEVVGVQEAESGRVS